MTNNNTLKFSELELSIGQTLQIHPSPNSSEKFDCLLVGCLVGEAVIVTVPASGEFPILEDGQQISIRVLLSSGVALFPTTVLFISDVPAYMVYLDFPQAIRFKQVRQAPRVDVNLPVLVSNKMDARIKGVVAQIIDLSTSGAKIQTHEELGKLGELIIVKGKFQVATAQRLVNIEAVIRSRSKAPDESIIYGLQFSEIEGHDGELVFLFGFIFSEMACGHLQHVR